MGLDSINIHPRKQECPGIFKYVDQNWHLVNLSNSRFFFTIYFLNHGGPVQSSPKSWPNRKVQPRGQRNFTGSIDNPKLGFNMFFFLYVSMHNSSVPNILLNFPGSRVTDYSVDRKDMGYIRILYDF